MLAVITLFVLLTALLLFGEPHELLWPRLLESPVWAWSLGSGLLVLVASVEIRRRAVLYRRLLRARAQEERVTAELEVTREQQQARIDELVEAAADANAVLEKVRAETTLTERKVEKLERALAEAEIRITAAQSKSADGARREEIDAEIVQFLSLLQDKGRFLDFLMDDITKYPNEQVGAAARLVHQGCRGLIREYFEIAPVHAGTEGDAVVLQKEYPTGHYRLLGKLAGEPPFRGTLIHGGWRTARVSLPRIVVRAPLAGSTEITIPAYHREIITPAEIEVK